jgi:hypothetical protein
MSVLKARLYEKRLDEQRSEMERFYGEKGEIGWGSQIRSYVLQPYQMVKDLRTGYSTSDTQGVLDGELDRSSRRGCAPGAPGTGTRTSRSTTRGTDAELPTRPSGRRSPRSPSSRTRPGASRRRPGRSCPRRRRSSRRSAPPAWSSTRRSRRSTCAPWPGKNLLRNKPLLAPWVADYLERGKPEAGRPRPRPQEPRDVPDGAPPRPAADRRGIRDDRARLGAGRDRPDGVPQPPLPEATGSSAPTTR